MNNTFYLKIYLKTLQKDPIILEVPFSKLQKGQLNYSDIKELVGEKITKKLHIKPKAYSCFQNDLQEYCMQLDKML